MPRRETRHDIERALSEQRNKRLLARDDIEQARARMEQDLARMRAALDPVAFGLIRKQFEQKFHRLRIEARSNRRRPRDGSMPALVEPPRGPKPLAGGAAAPLEFD
ncbi:MAG TPA: hypothetical protein VI168_16780 [Croceibacterium sp.]